VCSAILFSASVELARVDPFENYSLPHSEFFTPDHFRFYARLHVAPRYQIAGTKNQYHFLHRLFTATWQKERLVYDYAARPFVEPALRGLLEAMFLSTRTFPGIEVLVISDNYFCRSCCLTSRCYHVASPDLLPSSRQWTATDDAAPTPCRACRA
jgi:hypothetical protein